MEDSSPDGPEREQTTDMPSNLFLVLGLGFATIFLAWTILRTYREAFPS